VATTFDAHTRRVVIVTALAGFLSCLTVSVLLTHVALARRRAGELSILRRQIGIFVVCLFVSDLIQSISGMIQLGWAAHGGIVDGPSCTLQAVALLAGDLGTCFWNIVIAVHTFVTIVVGKRFHHVAVWIVVISGWLAVVFLTLLGPFLIRNKLDGPFFGIAGNWCFLTDNYARARLWIHYVPLFTSAAVIVVLYSVVFASLRKHAGSPDRPAEIFVMASRDEGLSNTHLRAIAKKMLWYPISYVTLILPISIARVAELHGSTVPDWAWNLGITFLFLSGFVNGIIYTLTRPMLSPTHWSRARTAILVTREEVQHTSSGADDKSGRHRFSLSGSDDKIELQEHGIAL